MDYIEEPGLYGEEYYDEMEEEEPYLEHDPEESPDLEQDPLYPEEGEGHGSPQGRQAPGDEEEDFDLFGKPSSPLPSPSPPRSGRNGPRSSSASGEPLRIKSLFKKQSGDEASLGSRRSKGTPDSKSGKDKSSEKSVASQRKPRGNLPQAPKFSGDRKADPSCFKKYANKVDSYVAIAEKIIDSNEIGLRLHAALEGEAEAYLEDVPAKAFGSEDGWKVLMRVLKEKFDETKMAKVGTAMKNFFKLQMVPEKDRALTMRDVADYMDKAARQCRDAGLTIPDGVMVYFFFEHSNASHERQANLLLRTNGAYDWSLMKKAVDLLYPTSTIRASHHAGKGGRARGAHEAQAQQGEGWSGDWPMPEIADPQLDEWMEYCDPVEQIADNLNIEADGPLPEGLARELHSCFTSHRENRQKLAKAVQARGYYVKGKGGSKGKGKPSKSGGKGKKSGKARGGLPLEELKAKTACGDCQQVGHWHGDPECPKRNSNVTGAAADQPEEEQYDEYYEPYDWYGGEWDPYEDHAEQDYHTAYVASPVRGAQAAQRGSSRSHRALSRHEELDNEAFDVAKNITALQAKRAKAGPSSSESRETKVSKSADYGSEMTANYLYVRGLLRASNENIFASESAGPRAVREARQSEKPSSSGTQKAKKPEDFEELGSVWKLLQDMPAPDVDSLRVRQTYAMRKVIIDDFANNEDIELIPDGIPRTVCSLIRRQPTVVQDKIYLTIDTACENTVCGSTEMQKLLNKLTEIGLAPTHATENEQYCFGPGAPQVSSTRLSVPIGIGNAPAIIRTSLIHEDKITGGAGPNGIPFLAGQDWLLMMKAIIDVGNDTIEFPAIGVKAPLKVDHSGHLVVAIDDFPSDGWPHGCPLALDEYPGAVFDGKKKSERGRSTCTVDSSPNYFYEPNQDNMNEGLSQAHVRVATDYWECGFDGMVIRHHCRPRDKLFIPEETHDRPDPQQLREERITVKAGHSPQFDRWQEVKHGSSIGSFWTGYTCFMLCDADVKNMKLPSKPSLGVEVAFADGFKTRVSPESLRSTSSEKQISKFDLDAKTPMFEHANSVRQTRFEIPQGQFGSNSIRSKPDHAKSVSFEEKMQSSRDVASTGPQALQLDDGDSSLDDQQHDGQRDEASGPGIDGLHGSPAHEGVRGSDGPIPSSNITSINHQCKGPDKEDPSNRLSGDPLAMPSRTGLCEKAGEQAWKIPGVHSARQDQEGVGGRLRDTDLPDQGDGLCHQPRSTRTSRRKDQASISQWKGINSVRHLGTAW